MEQRNYWEGPTWREDALLWDRPRLGDTEYTSVYEENMKLKMMLARSLVLPHSGCYRGTSLIRNSPLPKDHHRAIGIVLL